MDYTLHKILDLLWRKNIKEIDFCQGIGINKSAVTDWKNGKTTSYKRHLKSIAKYLGVTEDYLLEKNEINTVERIFSLMRERGVTAAKLTKDVGLSVGLTSQWKKGLQKPSAESIAKISNYFNVPTDYLLGITDNIDSKREKATIKDVPPELNDLQVAFSGGAGEGLTKGDIDMLLFLANKLKEKNQK